MKEDSGQKRLTRLIAKRDALFRDLARQLPSLDVRAIRQQELAIEAVAKKIAGTRAAITRAGGEYKK